MDRTVSGDPSRATPGRQASPWMGKGERSRMIDERALIGLCRHGDQRSFEQLVALKRDKAIRVAFNIVGDEDDAKDVAQQAFIRLWGAIRGYDDTMRFDPWFFRIVVNLAIDHYRRSQKRQQVAAGPAEGAQTPEGARDAGPSAPPADAALMRHELRGIFNRLAAGLGPVQRAVFTLKEIEGVDTVEIASILGIRESTVRNHLMQARRILREGMRRWYPEYAKDFNR
jgi:RNA polymerase sigma-70 factor (ECF subfamily)